MEPNLYQQYGDASEISGAWVYCAGQGNYNMILCCPSWFGDYFYQGKVALSVVELFRLNCMVIALLFSARGDLNRAYRCETNFKAKRRRNPVVFLSV
jgi:hypothetical protein